MPINAGPEFAKKYSEFDEAKTTVQKIRVLRELIAVAPKHKGAERLLMNLKKKLASLEDKAETEKRVGKGGTQKGIRKVAPLIVIVGPPGSGKTTLFKALTGVGNPKPWPFSTKEAVTAMAYFGDAKLQVIDCPSFDFAYANNADVIIFTGRDPVAEKKFKNRPKVFLEGRRPQEILYLAWKQMDLIRVYTEGENEPLLLRKGATIRNAAEGVHKTMVEGFEWAKVLRGEKPFRVGLDFVLQDMDKVWIKSRL